ncbi:DnaB-like helicase C-terminal domain-containing protein, partial [Escherichia coli]|uniref:DnaB-like helicase C-terminal domain-containing protein n=1 Tax=Escherichia coli TaxID=562 RepID=UPI002795B78D
GPNGSRGRTWAGPTDAREWVAARVAEINSETQVFEAPAADVLGEGRTFIEDYIKARDEDKSRRPMTGIEAFDDLTGGLGKGLIIVAGSSGFGKTQWCVSLAYYASQMQGLHVFFATSETVRSTVRARLIARHSRHEKFADDREALGLPLGLDSQK